MKDPFSDAPPGDPFFEKKRMEKETKRFELRWNDGKTEIVEGNDIADACRRAGIGAGALPALNYWKPLDESSSIGIGISMVSTEISSSECPGCGRYLDVATSFKGEEPEVGSASICSECGYIAIFDENLKLRDPTEAELEEIKKEPVVQQLLALMENVNRFRREKGEQE